VIAALAVSVEWSVVIFANIACFPRKKLNTQTIKDRKRGVKKILSIAKGFYHDVTRTLTMTKKTSKKSGELLSAKEAAERLNLTEQQTRALIRDGKLPATRIGRAWIIDAGDLPLAENRPKPGRPKKKKTDEDEGEDDEE
jgi:excisionase family DNA binding protein